jgi:hypothetical protein
MRKKKNQHKYKWKPVKKEILEHINKDGLKYIPIEEACCIMQPIRNYNVEEDVEKLYYIINEHLKDYLKCYDDLRKWDNENIGEKKLLEEVKLNEYGEYDHSIFLDPLCGYENLGDFLSKTLKEKKIEINEMIEKEINKLKKYVNIAKICYYKMVVLSSFKPFKDIHMPDNTILKSIFEDIMCYHPFLEKRILSSFLHTDES